jgi:hypothetical protein
MARPPRGRGWNMASRWVVCSAREAAARQQLTVCREPRASFRVWAPRASAASLAGAGTAPARLCLSLRARGRGHPTTPAAHDPHTMVDPHPAPPAPDAPLAVDFQLKLTLTGEEKKKEGEAMGPRSWHASPPSMAARCRSTPEEQERRTGYA